MATANLTAARLRELIHYDPETGKLQWIAWRPGVRKAHDRAGSIDRYGHRQLRIDGRILFAHRLAWLWMTGEWPNGNIDHINGVRDDNRWANLRVGTQQFNLQNLRAPTRNNRSGFLGVCQFHGKGKWIAQISVDNRTRVIGRFDTPEEAHAAYLKAKRVLHAGCTI